LTISQNRHTSISSAFIVLIFVAGLLVGGIATFFVAYREMSRLQGDVSNLKAEVSRLAGNQNVTYQNITIYQNNTFLIELYERVKDSTVLIQGTTSSGSVQGSGFVYNFTGTLIVVTNNHVVQNTQSLSVTFSNGDGYAATVLGRDPYADLAVLSVPDAPTSEFKSLDIVSSSTLRVGDQVIAVGNPYGLVGSMTTGIVSALGRTISEQYTGNFLIADIIQTSTPINPGNSGGPLLNFAGKVVGITTAIVENSQGLGFAVPSNTIRRELYSLITSGSYTGHAYLAIGGNDMTYETAQNLGVNVTFGVRIVNVIVPGPANSAGVAAGDILIGINGTRMRNMDEMSSYLVEKTLPGETIIAEIIRKNGTLQKLEIQVLLGTRPPPP